MGVLAGGFEAFHSAATATDRIAKEKAQTSILSSQAEEKKIEAESITSSYKTSLEKQALGKSVLSSHPDISLATEQGKAQYIDQMRKSAGNNPELQAMIQEESDKNTLALTTALKNKASQEESKQELLASSLQTALVNRTPEDWQKAIDNAPAEHKKQLQSIADLHQRPEYLRMSQSEKDTFDQAIVARYAPLSSKSSLAKLAADTEYKSKLLELKKAEIENSDKRALERVAAIRERNDEAIRKQDRTDRYLEGLSKEHNLYEDNRRNLMTQLQVIEPTQDSPYWFTGDEPNPKYDEVIGELTRLDKQHGDVVNRYKKKLGDDLPPEFEQWKPTPIPGQPTLDLKTQVEKAGILYEPDLYNYRITPDGKVQRAKKGE